MSFKENVLNIDFEIKKGKVLSYKDIAKMSGNINASRVVGNIMAKNQDKNIPCHRVVRSDGSVG
jgi:methylated-DNA-[protein]-cysteine S-methyltransferase